MKKRPELILATALLLVTPTLYSCTLQPEVSRQETNRTLSPEELGEIADYDRAIEINPQNARAYSNRGIARAKSGDIPGAIADYTEAIKINPQDAEAYGNRGFARYDSGDMQGFIEDMQEAERLFCQQGKPDCQKAKDILKRMEAGR